MKCELENFHSSRHFDKVVERKRIRGYIQL